jgi:hypothetical protein
MAHRILMDELHLRVTAPRGRRKREYHAIARVLRNKRFHAKLRRAIRDIFSSQTSLSRVIVALAS